MEVKTPDLMTISSKGGTALIAIALILIAFISGRYSAPDDSKAIEQRFEQERQRDRDSISALIDKLAAKSAESRTIREKMIQDSLEYACALERNNRAYTALKRKYNEINLSRADAHVLDSLVSVLFPD